MFIRSRSKHGTNRVRPIVRTCVRRYGEDRIIGGFETWKGSTIPAMAGVGGTDLPGTSVFGNGCGTCSPKQWAPRASKRRSPEAVGVIPQLTMLALAGGSLQHTSGQRLGTVTRSQGSGSSV